MSRHSKEDLAAAEFARTARGLLAMRAFPDEREPWLFVIDRGTFARRTDKGMWNEGWEPVHRWEITRSEFLAAQEAFTRRGEQPSRLALEDFAHRLGRSIVPDPKPELPTEPGARFIAYSPKWCDDAEDQREFIVAGSSVVDLSNGALFNRVAFQDDWTVTEVVA